MGIPIYLEDETIICQCLDLLDCNDKVRLHGVNLFIFRTSASASLMYICVSLGRSSGSVLSGSGAF